MQIVIYALIFMAYSITPRIANQNSKQFFPTRHVWNVKNENLVASQPRGCQSNIYPSIWQTRYLFIHFDGMAKTLLFVLLASFVLLYSCAKNLNNKRVNILLITSFLNFRQPM